MSRWASSSGGSSGSLEQSFPAASYVHTRYPSLRTLRSILANPRALDARSLASWNSSLRERLFPRRPPPHLISSEAVLSSALCQNSLPLCCRPASRKSPVDFSSIPAMSLPTCSSP
uniref:Uncharacterized protein n=1 Tax=Gadus morhua TaxID=8049 RepID=A0A8C5BHQ0_GADMO